MYIEVLPQAINQSKMMTKPLTAHLYYNKYSNQLLVMSDGQYCKHLKLNSAVFKFRYCCFLEEECVIVNWTQLQYWDLISHSQRTNVRMGEAASHETKYQICVYM